MRRAALLIAFVTVAAAAALARGCGQGLDISSVSSDTDFGPTDLSGLLLWLRARSFASSGSVGSTVSGNWLDESGAGNNLTTIAGTPTLTQPSGLSSSSYAVEFVSGSSESISVSTGISSSALTGLTIYAVSSKNDSATGYFVGLRGTIGAFEFDPATGGAWIRFGSAAASSDKLQARSSGGASAPETGSIASGSESVETFLIRKAIWNRELAGAELGYSIIGGNGATQTFGNSSTTLTLDQKIIIGAAGSGTFLSGRVSEILVWNRVLTTTEQGQVESYLRTTHGL